MVAAKSTTTERPALAILGGKPAFAEPLHVGRPNVGNYGAFQERVADMWDRRWLTNAGRYVEEFEQRVAALIGVKHCVATCNATAAIEIVVHALGLKGEVILPSFTFVAAANALQWQGVTPTFCDIEADNFNLDPERVASMITPRTTAIFPAHIFGRPADIEALTRLAADRGLTVFFDAAHALGCSYQGEMIGRFGRAEILSFHATKFINSMEGGAVVTNDDDLAHRLRLMKNFGFTSYDRTDEIGINGKMTEVCAAMGLTSFEAMPEIVEINRRNWGAYRDGLKKLPGISLIEYSTAEQHNYHYVIVEVDSQQAPLNRDELLLTLHRENVLARRYFWPGCHRMAPYASLYPNAGSCLPQTERVAGRVLALPTGQTITLEIIETICEIISAAFSYAGRIRSLSLTQAQS